MNTVNCTEFSYISGVSKAAIVKAKNRGEIIQESDGKYYDLDNSFNNAYLQKLIDREAAKHAPKPEKPKAKKKSKKVKSEPKPKAKPKTIKKNPDKPKPKPARKSAPKKTVIKKPTVKPKKAASSPPVKNTGINARADIDMKIKEIQLKTSEVKYHQLLGDVIERDSIQFVWNKIYKASTYFQDFGQKFAGEWAAALGISDSTKILDLQQMIDTETEKFMEAFTETVASEI